MRRSTTFRPFAESSAAIPSKVSGSTWRPATSAEAEAHALVRFGYLAAAATSAMLLLAHFGNATLLGGRHAWLLDANEEGTPFTWLSVMACSLVAIAGLLAALLTTRHQRTGFGLFAACGFLSLDDGAQLHERIAEKVYRSLGLSSTWDSVIWPVLYLPLLAVTAWLIVRVAGSGSLATLQAALAGLGMLVLAVATEVLFAPWSTGTNTIHTIQGGIEEALELAGWTVAGFAVLAAVVMQIVRKK